MTVLALLTLPLMRASALELTGAGSTFAYPILARWADAYHKLTGHKINYQSIGSGGGIKQITRHLVDFGTTDVALDAAELKDKKLYQFPLVAGEIVAIVQIADLTGRGPQLNGTVLADIFLGKIQNWNDARLRALNPSLNLPDLGITVVHRADGSGTTYNWTRYLSAENSAWKQAVGTATAVRWPTGVGGKGNEGVAAFVKRIEGSIGYVEMAFVKAAKLKTALLPKSVLATTYVLLPQTLAPMERGQEALRFFRWALEQGASAARALDYQPLAPGAVGSVIAGWRKEWPAITAGL